MKKVNYIQDNIYSMDSIFGMANINPDKAGIPVIIWSEHQGRLRNVEHKLPRIKLGKDDYSVVVTIEENPKILTKSRKLTKSEQKNIEKGINYIGRNYDIFLMHYNDTDFSFDDEDMFNALRERGEYR